MQSLMILKNLAEQASLFLEVRFMLKMNCVKLENVCNKFRGSSNLSPPPPKKVHLRSIFNKLS